MGRFLFGQIPYQFRKTGDQFIPCCSAKSFRQCICPRDLCLFTIQRIRQHFLNRGSWLICENRWDSRSQHIRKSFFIPFMGQFQKPLYSLWIQCINVSRAAVTYAVFLHDYLRPPQTIRWFLPFIQQAIRTKCAIRIQRYIKPGYCRVRILAERFGETKYSAP